jgi:hypothetical protein
MNTEYAVGNIRIHFESRTRRRWFVALIYGVLAVIDLGWFSVSPKQSIGRWILSGCLMLGVALLLIFRSIPGDIRVRGDEREMHRRDHAHFRAYYFLGYGLIAALMAGYFRGPNPITPLLPPTMRAYIVQLPFILLAATGILYLTLPQAILLWTEPDMDQSPELAPQ